MVPNIIDYIEHLSSAEPTLKLTHVGGSRPMVGTPLHVGMLLTAYRIINLLSRWKPSQWCGLVIGPSAGMVLVCVYTIAWEEPAVSYR